jgi:hypothetical protein
MWTMLRFIVAEAILADVVDQMEVDITPATNREATTICAALQADLVGGWTVGNVDSAGFATVDKVIGTTGEAVPELVEGELELEHAMSLCHR